MNPVWHVHNGSHARGRDTIMTFSMLVKFS